MCSGGEDLLNSGKQAGYFASADMKCAFFWKCGIGPASTLMRGELFVPIFWHSRFSEFSVKFSIVCPSVVSL